MGVRFTDPATVHAPVGSYSHAAVVPAGTTLLFISGQIGMAPDGTVPPDMAGQADLAFANLLAVLASEGLTPADLVKVTLYAVAGQPLAHIREARIRHYGDARPASTFITVPQLVEARYLIEVEAVAARRT